MSKHAAPRRQRGNARVKMIGAAAVAVVATGSAFALGSTSADEPAQAAIVFTHAGGEVVDRDASLSRDTDRRQSADPTKAAALASAASSDVKAVSGAVDAAKGDPKAAASALLSGFGWGGDQFSCLDKLWTKESNWNPRADNPSSSAYGIPQALPGSKMSSAGSDWLTNPVTQIKWGLGYIDGRYGSPCAAWGHSQARGWY